MRDRQKILGNLDSLYREGFLRAEEDGNQEAMVSMDFDFQRDQLFLEALLDILKAAFPFPVAFCWEIDDVSWV